MIYLTASSTTSGDESEGYLNASTFFDGVYGQSANLVDEAKVIAQPHDLVAISQHAQ